VGIASTGTVPGDHLTIYSSLPLQGPLAAVSAQIVNGEKLALAQTRGRVGRFRIYYQSLDDVNPKTGEWAPGETATDAKYAAQDSTTIAYLGDFSSEATAISLPIVNAAGALQVSPTSPYVGLTSSLDANQDEPERFYPTGKRTFARIMPADPVQAAAQVELMRSLRVGRVYVMQDEDPFDLPLAAILSEDAKHAGVQVVGESTLDTTASTEFAGEAKKVAESGAQAVFFSGMPNAGAVALWQQLHAADPHLRLLGSSTLAEGFTAGAPATDRGPGPSGAPGANRTGGGAETAAAERSFAARIGAAGASTYLGSPMLPVSLYPPAAQDVLGEYRSQFHEAGSAYALYGYETMNAVLLAIRRAGRHGNDRQSVIDKFFRIRDRESVLGNYSIDADGDSTLARYGFDRVSGGRLVFFRAFDADS
jgi:branched-chain amino acid transport system substrate-binding protein